MESLELFGREVLPEFMDATSNGRREKAKRARPVHRTACMARKPASDHPPLPTDDYAFPAIPRAMADRAGSDDFHTWLDDFAAQSAAGGDELRNLIG